MLYLGIGQWGINLTSNSLSRNSPPGTLYKHLARAPRQTLAHFHDFAFKRGLRGRWHIFRILLFRSQHGPTQTTAHQRSFLRKTYIISANLFGNDPNGTDLFDVSVFCLDAIGPLDGPLDSQKTPKVQETYNSTQK